MAPRPKSATKRSEGIRHEWAIRRHHKPPASHLQAAPPDAHPRAAIFSPFAALSGHGAAIAETARLTEQKIELDEDTKAELDRRQAVLLEYMDERPELTVTWFQRDEKKDGGAYLTTTGRLKKLRELERSLVLTDGTEIPLEDVVTLESDIFQTLM